MPILPDPSIAAAARPTDRPPGRLPGPLPVALLLCGLAGLLMVSQILIERELHIPAFSGVHTALELLSITMSLMIATTSWARTDASRPQRLFAIGFLLTGLLDLLHTLSYAGMPSLLSDSSPQKAIAFWLAGRLMVTMTLLGILLQVRWQHVLALLLTLGSFVYSALALHQPEALPTFYREGQGLTPLKIGLEWLIAGSYLLLAFLLRYSTRLPFDSARISAGLLVLGTGELLFTLYHDVDGLSNGLGHLFKIIGQGFFFAAVIDNRLLKPWRDLAAARAEREDAFRRTEALISGAPLGILVVEQDGRISLANPAAEQLFHADQGELIGLGVDALVPEGNRARHPGHRAAYGAHPGVISMSDRPELEALRRDGSRFHVAVALAPLEWNERKQTLAFVSDISAQTGQLRQLRWLAHHDELTRLPNRRATEVLLEEQLATQQRGAVLLFGLDSLKRVNQVFSHETGDRLLASAADRLQAQLHKDEQLARLQGDTFMVILPGEADVDARARSMLACFETPFTLPPDIHLQVSATGGYVRFPEDGDHADLLLQHAELALAAAKRSHRRSVASFDRAHTMRARRWLDLASHMPAAFAAGEFFLVFQPRVLMDGGRLAGFEVLCRWRSADGLINPAEFIPVAEESGFILELGRWVIDAAVAQTAAWLRAGIDTGRVAINLSTRQLADHRLLGFLDETLARHQLEAARLELEITETAAMENLDWALPRLQAIRQLGICIALDDFGTGYSSLSYLQGLPISVLKIDAAFIRQLHTETGQAVTRTVIALARSLHLHTVAEGVETPEQQHWLRAQGCDEMQGYLEAKPMPANEMETYLRQHRLP